MKKLLFSFTAVLFLLGCSLDHKDNSPEVSVNESVQVTRSNTGFKLPVCKNASCPRKGTKMTKFVRIIFENRHLPINADLNCNHCDRLYNHKHSRFVSLNLYECTGCGRREGGAKVVEGSCTGDLPLNVVQFPDKNLENEIRKELGKDSGYLTKDDLLSIKELDMALKIFGKDLRLDGIGLCENLESLEIGFANSIKDLAPLKDLSKLKNLSITSCNVSDISSLRHLVTLNTLRLDRNKISDISSLAYLTNLDRLYMSYNNVSNLSPLRNLVELDWLFMEYNQITDISPLTNLKSINRLYLKNNRIESIQAVKDYTYLRYIDIEDNRVKSIAPLMNHKYITLFRIWDNNMDLRRGTTNRAVVDAIIYRNRNNPRAMIYWRSGNIVD